MRKKRYDQLLEKMSYCTRCVSMTKKNGKECSLINIYHDQEFCKNIPSIWTD